jgi:iron complex outermembrane receptor protein
MKHESVLRFSVLASAVSAALVGFSVQAQEQQPEEITVTGSRIVRRDLEANSPILTLDSRRLEESSSIGIESVVNQLPSFVPAVGSFSTGVGLAGGFNDQIATGSTRTPSQATLSLRGLGANRNLVLLDGNRAMPINASMAVSINTIPAAAIERIETITGGASSVYGADAVAGVVNFITKRDFEGFDFDAQYGATAEGDGDEFRFSGLMGANFSDNRGNVLLGFERSERTEILRTDRDYLLDGFADTRSNTYGAFWGAQGYSPVASNLHSLAALDAIFGAGRFSAATRNQQFYMNDDGTLYTADVNIAAYRYNAGGTRVPGQTTFTRPHVAGIPDEPGVAWRKLDESGGQQQGRLKENLIDANLQSPLSRYSLFGRAHMDLSESVEAFTTVTYSESSTQTSADNSPMLGGWRASAPHGTGLYLPSVANLGADGLPNTADAGENMTTLPNYLPGGSYGLACAATGGCTKSQAFPTPPELTALLDSRPNREADWEFRQLEKWSGLRRSDASVQTHQILGGLQGTLPIKDWTWSFTASNGATDTQTIYGGVVSLERYRLLQRQPNYGRGARITGNALGAGFASDTITCTSGIGGASGVSGYTEFFIPSEDCRKAMTASGKVSGRMTQNILEYNMQGLVAKMPAGELRFSFGAGSRENFYTFSNDPLSTPQSVTDQLGGFFPAGDSSGKTTVDEAYGELLVPLLKDMKGAKELNLELGFRHTDNAPASDANSYKALIDWRVVDRVRFRGGRQVANRAPNIGELFQSSEQLAPFTNVQGDPCSTRDPQTRADIALITANPVTNPAHAAQVQALCSALMGPNAAATFYGDINNQSNQLVQPRISNLNGNPNLVPENAATFTFGAVIDVAETQNLTIDYWRIKVDDMIAPQDVDSIYATCLSFVTNPAFDVNHPFCQQVRRDPTTGAHATNPITFTNQAQVDLSGIDVQYNWRHDLGGGSLSLTFLASFLDSYEARPNRDQAFVDYKGTSGPSAVAGVNRYAYDYKMFTTLGYRIGNWDASLRHRYLPSITHEANILNNQLLYAPTGSYKLFDATMRYGLKKMEVRFGIDNLLNAQPETNWTELGATTTLYDNEGVTNPAFYDVVGRRFYVGFKMNL